MLNIAVVDDDEQSRELILSFLKKYEGEYGEKIVPSCFADGKEFIFREEKKFDVILMDIAMPEMNGMDAAKKLRSRDPFVPLIFITNLSQLAIKGYEVDAMDFIVKPVSYYNFATKLKRAIDTAHKQADMSISFFTKDGYVKIFVNDIVYVDVFGHTVTYHTVNGDFSVRGTLTEVENMLEKRDFSRSDTCYIVNLNYVTKIEGNSVFVGDAELTVSRHRKKAFLQDLTRFVGSNNGIDVRRAHGKRDVDGE